jgi:hypothetical protein
MEYATHKKIHNFDFNGTIHDDKDIIRLRAKYEIIAEEYMRNKGYIPHLDLDPVFTIEYTTAGYNFKYTRYGVYVGKAKARCYQAVVGTRLIPMNPIPKDRLKKFSPNAV